MGVLNDATKKGMAMEQGGIRSQKQQREDPLKGVWVRGKKGRDSAQKVGPRMRTLVSGQ